MGFNHPMWGYSLGMDDELLGPEFENQRFECVNHDTSVHIIKN